MIRQKWFAPFSNILYPCICKQYPHLKNIQAFTPAAGLDATLFRMLDFHLQSTCCGAVNLNSIYIEVIVHQGIFNLFLYFLFIFSSQGQGNIFFRNFYFCLFVFPVCSSRCENTFSHFSFMWISTLYSSCTRGAHTHTHQTVTVLPLHWLSALWRHFACVRLLVFVVVIVVTVFFFPRLTPWQFNV